MLNELTTAEEPKDAIATIGRGMLIVVSSPSGGGKGTLIDRVLKTVPGVSYSVSYTTRPPREGEQHGREYSFVSTHAFEEMIRRGEFLEWANVYGYLYGTNRAQVEREPYRRGIYLFWKRTALPFSKSADVSRVWQRPQ